MTVVNSQPTSGSMNGAESLCRRHWHLVIVLLVVTGAMVGTIFAESGAAVTGAASGTETDPTFDASRNNGTKYTPTGTSGQNQTDQATIHGAFFYDPQCPSCQAAYAVLETLENDHPQFHAWWFNVSSEANRTKAQTFLDEYNVHSLYHGDYPFLFIGDHAFSSRALTYANVSTVLERYANTTVPLYPAWNLDWRLCMTLFYRESTERGAAVTELLADLDEPHVTVAMVALDDEPYHLDLFSAYLDQLNRSTIGTDVDACLVFGERVLVDDAITNETLSALIDEARGTTVECREVEVEYETGTGKVCVLIFYSPTCSECTMALNYLRSVRSARDDIELDQRSLAEPGNAHAMITMLKRYNRSEAAGGSLAVFIGDHLFTTYDGLNDGFEAALAQYEENGVECPEVSAEPEDTREYLQHFEIAFVLGAGLLDGVNPCAFAILVFFITYLLLTGHDRRRILVIGVSFSIGVFLAYLLLGLGLYYLLGSLTYLTQIKIAIYMGTGVVAIVLGAYSFFDAKKAKYGSSKEMVLKIPRRFRKLSDRVIAEHVRMRYFALIAVSTGMAISMFEFMCTGQVYIPVIVAMTSMGGGYTLAYLYLILYNLMFIVPLIAIFLTVYFGSSSDQLRTWLRKRLALIKSLTGMFLVGLGAVMFYLGTRLL